jgi:hypothetical protein
MLTQERLKQLLVYDPETGVFTHKVTRQGVRAGTRAGTIGIKKYVGLRIDGGRYTAHRLAFLWMIGSFPEFEVDHINRIRYDNRWSNLRAATRQQNCRNSPLRPRDLPRGVYKSGPKYQARISINNKCVHLGNFQTVKEAEEAYIAQAYILYGEFA